MLKFSNFLEKIDGVFITTCFARILSIDHRDQGVKVIIIYITLLCVGHSARYVAGYKVNDFVRQVLLSSLKSL